jgi:hypothetical protein
MRAYVRFDLEHAGAPQLCRSSLSRLTTTEAIVLPLVGIADLALVEGLELDQRLLAVAGVIPGQALDVLAQAAVRASIILFMRAFVGAERLLDVELAEGIAGSRSVACTQRFQRGSISFAPLRYCRLNRKSSSTKALLR